MMDLSQPAPLGATLVDGGVNFGLYSSVAERVQVCLYDNGVETQRLDLQPAGDGIWSVFAPGLGEGQRYGYRVHGPYAPAEGLHCNSEKLLIDPYARQLDGEFQWREAVFGTQPGDSAEWIPKGVVTGPVRATTERPTIPWSETIFYEANLRGITMRHPDVPESERGRFAGLRNAEVLQYIKSLGITSIELMPVFAFIDEFHLVSKGLRNLWGYNPINFFSPMPRYAGQQPVVEFRDMVDAIHDAGLEVILDVAYNHTGEGGDSGPMLSFRGIDNASYYRLEPRRPGRHVNDTGCGNTINADSPVVQRLIIDSLRYWSGELGVDGFRFDLATILGRHATGFSGEHPLLHAIGSDPLLAQRKIIAEPWDPGPGGYRLGQFPPPWAEWNDEFRDTARRFWRGDDNHTGDLARRFHGSADIFEASGRPPHASVNMITSHDGFTLVDLASYERRHNAANGEGNRDGHAHNFSCNHGVEGPSDEPAIRAARRQHRLNLLATLMLSQGTPLLLAGDEFGNSQTGNNNAYAQDNEIGWLDWSGLRADPAFTGAVRHLIELRRKLPMLRLDHYVHGTLLQRDKLIRLDWVNPDGRRRDAGDWDFGHAFGALYETSVAGGTGDKVAVLFNAWEGELEFELPNPPAGADWRVAFVSAQDPMAIERRRIRLPGRSIAVLVAGLDELLSDKLTGP